MLNLHNNRRKPSRRVAAPVVLLPLAVLVLASALVTAPHAAQAAEGQFYLAPGLQWMKFDNEAVKPDHIELRPDTPEGISYQLSEDVWYYAGLGYDLTDRFSLELSTFDLDPRLSGSRQKVDIDHYKLDGIYDLGFDVGRGVPFVLAGVGHVNFDGESDTLWDVGLGLEFPLTDRLSLRTTARSFHPLSRNHEDNDFGVDLSLMFYLGEPVGGPRETRRRLPARDSDNDGVPDSRDECPDTPLAYRVDRDGCPIPVDEVARMELLVNFEFDRSEVRSQYFDAIGEVAEFLEQYPDLMVDLEGHTDSVGTDAYNQGLSERRANAVRDVLIDRFGVAASRVTTTGYGESEPVTSNRTERGRAQNRRVITVVIQTRQNYRSR